MPPGAVLAVLDVAVITQRQVGVSRTVELPQIHFIAPSADIPVAEQRRVRTVQPVQGVPCLADVVAAMRVFCLFFEAFFRTPSN